jgi:hypothetical protein
MRTLMPAQTRSPPRRSARNRPAISCSLTDLRNRVTSPEFHVPRVPSSATVAAGDDAQLALDYEPAGGLSAGRGEPAEIEAG